MGALSSRTIPSRTRPLTSDGAINELIAGNQRYVSGRSDSHNHPPGRTELAAGQHPFAGIIRCADSRVAPEIVFDQPLGSLFVCGVAGNVPTREIVASMEYAVAALGCRLIVVMGHTSCGAVAAAVKHRQDSEALRGEFRELIEQIVLPSVAGWGTGLEGVMEEAVVCNAKEGVAKILRTSEVLSDAVVAGELKIVAGVYDIESGEFSLLTGAI